MNGAGPKEGIRIRSCASGSRLSAELTTYSFIFNFTSVAGFAAEFRIEGWKGSAAGSGAEHSSMKGSICLRSARLALLWLVTLTIPAPASAALIENFSYSNGNLTTVSGGAWQFWEPGAGNGTIVNGAFRYDGITDLIRTYPSVLNAPGDLATISFTINVNLANTTEGYAIDFLPASAPFGSANTNYGNQISMGFDYGTSAPGFVSIEVAEGGSPQTAWSAPCLKASLGPDPNRSRARPE